jgi:hypothetical protein
VLVISVYSCPVRSLLCLFTVLIGSPHLVPFWPCSNWLTSSGATLALFSLAHLTWCHSGPVLIGSPHLVPLWPCSNWLTSFGAIHVLLSLAHLTWCHYTCVLIGLTSTWCQFTLPDLDPQCSLALLHHFTLWCPTANLLYRFNIVPK